MDLVGKCFNVFRALEVGLELFDVRRGLVARREHAKRDRDLLGIGGVDHGWVDLGAGAKAGIGGGAHDGDDFTSPAEADNAPGLDVGVLLFDVLDDAGDAGCGFWGCSSGGEEFFQSFAFLWCVWRVPITCIMSSLRTRKGTGREANQEMSAGLPSKKSGIKTLYVWSLSEDDRISAPWIVWGKYPKIS